MAFRLAAKFIGRALPPRRLFNWRPLDGKITAAAAATAAACGAAVVFVQYNRRTAAAPVSVAAAGAAAPSAAESVPERSLNWRERHFLAHASLQYDGIAYLSPVDFLESVALLNDLAGGGVTSAGFDDAMPSHKRKHSAKKHKRRRVLAESDYRAIIRSTPSKKRASDRLFSDIGTKGLISYPEYLLLLNILNKSRFGFNIAFRAFDRNNDGRLDVEEFRSLYRVVTGSAAPDSCSSELLAFGVDQNAPSTTLLVHFFGSDCRDTVSAVEFSSFADNLQREVLMFEFKTGCGQTSTTMSPVDFGRAVLRRTRLAGSESRLRLDLLEERVWQSEGVTAEEYTQFFQFLLYIDDMFFALRMFDIAGKSIEQEDFQQAVKAVTGQSVSPKLLTIVFALFDVNGDGALSYGEFLNLFGHQDTLLKRHSSLAGTVDETWWDRYRKCVKKHMLLQQ